MADGEPSHQDKLAASTAIFAAVSAATLTSNIQTSADDSKREFGTVAYERVLPRGDCRCVERTSTKLQALDNVVRVWVRDARSFRHGLESPVPYFSLRVAAAIPVTQLRVRSALKRTNPQLHSLVLQGLVQEQFALLSSYRKEVDGELQLCFDDRVLDDEDAFSAYLSGGSRSTSAKTGHVGSTGHRQPSWPKPFVGILWVLPWHPSRQQPLQWGSGDNIPAPSHSSNLSRPKPTRPTQLL
ncbi:hypothetical protein PR003_g23317 [Phytophthora rubi]|uniref:Uncharacterized protein n=1 Tax=Phytophthora rubi TaxID=129364 RepID=A0A6A3JA58_9STRA|nr:hypothetical protein PR002_g23036 [Phytophthora rubi]KAE8989255.1 hypothetical protein PR001_g21820 [Phytophthora rubi]KAE9298145.1 hypothetical protein PR003_g23317 [Phytophthora rubi]